MMLVGYKKVSQSIFWIGRLTSLEAWRRFSCFFLNRSKLTVLESLIYILRIISKRTVPMLTTVYGANKKVPFEEIDFVDNPVSLYASTKKSNELMAHTYSHLYNIPATGLRFFTVYSPMGRPDMAYFGFTDKYFASEPIKIFNNGDFENDLYRDFTYIDDIVEGIE